MVARVKLPPAQFLSFIALLCLHQNIYLAVILNSFSAPAPGGPVLGSGIFSFIGMALSSFLCPLFLPIELCRKKLPSGIIFISAIILPNIILRSLGAELFNSSASIRAVTMFLSGMIYPFAYGLFFLTHLLAFQGAGENRLSRSCTVLFSIAIAAGIIVSHFALPLLKLSGLSREPVKAMSVVFNTIKWLFIVVGAVSIAVLILLNKEGQNKQLLEEQNTAIKTVSPELKTNLSIILRLIGLSVVYRTLNGIMNFRLLSILNYLPAESNSYPLIIAAAIILITLLARRSTTSFMKWFLPLSISLFILLPCLILFGTKAPFVFFMNILVGTFSYLLWIFFSIALVEYYIPSRPEKSRFSGFWFYSLAVMMFFTNVFSFAVPLFSRNIPSDPEYTVLIATIAAIVFFFLSFRILFPKAPPAGQTAAESLSKESVIFIPQAEFGSLDHIYRKHKLSKREIEVADLLVIKGLGAREIANRLFISHYTVNDHIANIYKKFAVKSRGEFMAKVIQGK